MNFCWPIIRLLAKAMKLIRSQFVVGALLSAGMALAQQPATPPSPATPPAQAPAATDQNRDLNFKKDTTKPAGEVTVKIPRSYALVVGISKYANLPADAQLEYPDRDAESPRTSGGYLRGQLALAGI